MRTRRTLILASLALAATLLFSGAAFAQGNGPGPDTPMSRPAITQQNCGQCYAQWDGPRGPKPHKVQAQHRPAPVPAHYVAPAQSVSPLIINIGFD